LRRGCHDHLPAGDGPDAPDPRPHGLYWSPLIGDPVYLRRRPAAAKALPETVRDLALDFPRQALHAETLGFSHPITGAMLRFTAPPPPDFQALADALQACV